MSYPTRPGPEYIRSPLDDLPDVRKYIVPGIVVAVVLGLLATGLYSVGADEVGVIQRFGRYVRQTEPGLHMKVPFGIERATKVKVRYIFK